MNLRFTLLCGLAALGVLASCAKDETVAPVPVAVDKTVSYEIFASKDNSTSFYADSLVRTSLWVTRTDKATMKQVMAFDTTFTKSLKEFPLKGNKLVLNKRIAGVVDQNEWIGVGGGARVGGVAYSSYESFPENLTVKKVEIPL